jgi:DNA-binding FadR family transcriptional regulator
MKQPRLAEMVASDLRESIVSGELPDTDTLPTLDRLVERFQVSPAPVREALRILENEGLISIRRGNVGGALVHRPQPESAAYMLGLVLQSQRVRASDLVLALLEFQPLSVSLCARSTKHVAISESLGEALDKADAAVPDLEQFGLWVVAFHERMVEHAGNETLKLVANALGALWAAQGLPWPHRLWEVPADDPESALHEVVARYRPVVAAIKKGDAQVAADIMRTIIEDPEAIRSRVKNPVIHATQFQPRDLANPWTAQRASQR